jgi:hypothetical protein
LPETISAAADQCRVGAVVGDVGIVATDVQTCFQECGTQAIERAGAIDDYSLFSESRPARLRTRQIRGDAAVLGPE